METWSLNHPKYGLIELRVGFDRDFAAETPEWPGDETDKEGTLATDEHTLRERVALWAQNPSERMEVRVDGTVQHRYNCLLYTSPSPRDRTRSRMPSSA